MCEGLGVSTADVSAAGVELVELVAPVITCNYTGVCAIDGHAVCTFCPTGLRPEIAMKNYLVTQVL